MYVLMESDELDTRPVYKIISPEEGFKTEQEAEDWAYDNDYLDVVLMKFVRFV